MSNQVQHWKQNDTEGLWKTDLAANDSTAQEELGSVRRLRDGRAFRYIQMTGSAAAEGTVLMNGTKVAISSAATGGAAATSNVVTVSGASYTANAYVGWYFQSATAGTGSVTPRKIVANTATTLTLEKPLATACSSDTAEIIAPMGVGIKCTANDLDVVCVGVTQGTITQNYYGWAQIQGIGSVLASTALSEGDSCSTGGSTAGEAADRAGSDDNLIGVCIAASGSGECQLVDLCIAG